MDFKKKYLKYKKKYLELKNQTAGTDNFWEIRKKIFNDGLQLKIYGEECTVGVLKEFEIEDTNDIEKICVDKDNDDIEHDKYNEDYDIVLNAVKNNGLSLNYVNKMFYNDLLVVGIAIDHNKNAIEFMDKKLKENPIIKKIIDPEYTNEEVEIVKKNTSSENRIYNLGFKIIKDSDFTDDIINLGKNYKSISEKEEGTLIPLILLVYYLAFKKNGLLLEHLPDAITEYPAVYPLLAKTAIQNNANAIKFATKKFN